MFLTLYIAAYQSGHQKEDCFKFLFIWFRLRMSSDCYPQKPTQTPCLRFAQHDVDISCEIYTKVLVQGCLAVARNKSAARKN